MASRTTQTLAAAFMGCSIGLPAAAIEIEIDYTFDSQGFFDTNTTDGVAARTALEAVAARYSTIITTPLGAASINDTNDGRIGFSDPGTGNQIQLSGAASASSDLLVTNLGVSEADVYGARTFEADKWTLFAGGRSLGSAGEGGTGTGTNLTTTFSDGASHLNRGFNSGIGSLPLWGGSITFDNDGDRDWNFSIDTASGLGESDFYTIALHEVGHALGLSLSFTDFTQNVSGDQFTGENALAAANADNGTSLTDIDLVSATNLHFADNDGNGSSILADPDAIQSFIFDADSANLAGTVGADQLQDLLLEPIANNFFDFGNPANSVSRFELTNVDVGALQDIGFTIIPEPSTALLAGLGLFLMRNRSRRSA